ncbi:MAG: HAMP domain-containing histidine kinase [Proteobacteria bacterium]|nr:HAMP domain-containing histidine kinase [Pseudomonadota bacterium]
MKAKNPSKGWLRNRSILFKLLLVIVVAAVSVNLVAIIFVRLAVSNPGHNFQKYFRANVERILQQVGHPPKLDNARRIRENHGILIRYEGAGSTWSTFKDMPSLKKIRYRAISSDFGIRQGRYWFRSYLVIKKGRDHFIITPEYIQKSSLSDTLILVLLALLSLIFIGAYLIIRKILYPIYSLRNGVQQVGNGNFDHQLPVTKNDELGQLTLAFNLMTQKVKEILHSKEQLMLNVSHEMRSPLTRMKIALELWPKSKAKKNVNEEVRVMETMIAELLESARLDSGYGELHLQETDLCRLVAGICREFEKVPPGMECRLPPTSLDMLVDAERLETVFRNLLDNAFKYSADADRPVQLDLERQREHARIRIRDFGHGIPSEDQPFLFEPFYRVDKSRSKKTGGFGLGLGLCKRIVEAHNGTIQIESQPDRGTEVAIELPFSKEK